MRLSLLTAGVVIGVGLMAVPAQAAPAAISKNLTTAADSQTLLLRVQHHGHRGGGGGHRGGGGGGGGNGGAIAAGVIGGVILGAIIANEAQRQQAINYCARRYRSFDPGSMTFLGRDGRRYRCP